MRMKKILPGFLLFCLLGIICGMTASAETFTDRYELIVGNVQVIKRVVASGYIQHGETTGNPLPKGVTYNAASNTLILQNCTLAGKSGENNLILIDYDGKRDLNLQILGKNTFQDAYMGVSMRGGGNLNVFGGGTLQTQNCLRLFCNFNGADIKPEMPADGHFGIYINGVTLVSDGCVIANTLSTLSISNAVISQTNVNGYTVWKKYGGDFYASDDENEFTEYALAAGYGESFFTGMGADGKPMFSYQKGGGDLIIKNSTITLKNSKAAIKCRKYQLNGLNAYIGKEKPQSQLTKLEMKFPNSFAETNNDQYYVLKNQGGYLLITPETVSLQPETCEVHKFGPYITTKEPTVTTPGVATRTCTVCGETQTKTLPKLSATVRFSTDTLALQIGKSVSLRNYVTGMQKGDSISRWNSFATNIASVDANGNVTAKRAGKAYIAVGTKEGAVAKILITVQDTAVHTTGISGLHTGIALEAGKTVALRPVITPANSQDPVQYASVAPNIVTVSANGVVKGIRAGSAYVYVKSGTKYVKILVKVTAGSLTAITGVRTTGSLYVRASYQLRPQRYPAGSAGVFYYKSSDPSVAVVDQNGKITAKKKGMTVITVTARNVSASMRLTVK